MVYFRGGQTFSLGSQIQTIKSTAGRREKFQKNINILSPQQVKLMCFPIKIMPKIYVFCFLKGPQKMFGGPHAARRPQIDHAWYIKFKIMASYLNV
jgi:hypothetical protein